jgi:hypothetical protein
MTSLPLTFYIHAFTHPYCMMSLSFSGVLVPSTTTCLFVAEAMPSSSPKTALGAAEELEGWEGESVGLCAGDGERGARKGGGECSDMGERGRKGKTRGAGG